jgi:hypothetical protein
MSFDGDEMSNFISWLDTQRRCEGWIGMLAQIVAMDTRIPRNASPELVRSRLCEVQAERELLQALDEAVTDWRADRIVVEGHFPRPYRRTF